MKKFLSLLRNHWFFFTFLAIIVVVTGAYLAGFRVAPGPSITQVGTLIITDAPEKTEVFVDGVGERVVSGDAVRISIYPGTHTIIVAAPGTQPWNELVTVLPGESLTVHPIYSPTTLQAHKLTAEEIPAARTAMWNYTLPTKAEPIVLHDGCVIAYALQNRIVAEAVPSDTCTPPAYLCSGEECAPTVVFPAVEALRSFYAFPGRNDALLASSGSYAFILELDPREPQFFAPLYKGKVPLAIPWTESSFLLRDGETFLEIQL